MIYCLSGSQNKEYLLKADEVNIPYSKLHYVSELLHLREGKVRVVITLDQQNIDWKELAIAYKACEHCQVAITYPTDIIYCQDNGIKNYFFQFPIRDFYTLNYYLTLGICAARIATPLTHYLTALAAYDIEIRAYVNSSGAVNPDDPASDGLVGGWFRPEDMANPLVTNAIQVAEFDFNTIEQEQALWRIYTKGEWPGELYMIVPSIHDKEVLNRALPPNFGERRADCGQRCQRGSVCKFCRLVAGFAKIETMRKVKELMTESAGE